MPVTVEPSSKSPNRARLVQELAQALAQPEAHRSRTLRLIQKPLEAIDQVEVVLIWENWKGIPFQERSKIILEAFDAARHDLREKVYTAIGRTIDEAITLGYLPFSITPLTHHEEGRLRDELLQIMRSEGAIDTKAGPQLRFQSIEEAEEVYKRLLHRKPGPYWTLIHELPREF